jgi:hypothetical protein
VTSAEQDEVMMTRKQAADYLRQHGFPVTRNFLEKVCAPSRDEGPEPAGQWGKIWLYTGPALLAWARGRLRNAPSQAP